jgi:hypothetical protein
MDHVGGIEGTGAESNAPAGSDLTRRWLADWLAIGIFFLTKVGDRH